jgi:lysophospholipid acyltransferase (LPLAT)-like uncharacterized protein
MKNALRYRLGSRAGQLTLDALLATCRWQERGVSRYDEHWRTNSGLILTCWHGRLLSLAYHYRGRGFVPIISKSGDGEYIARIVKHWGYDPVRGSSSRGGTQALREIVKRGRKGKMLVFTPDGPRGPRNEVKPGILLAAQLTGMPIIPAAAAATSAWWFEGWDRFMVPKPFARVVVGFGEPVFVARDADEAALNVIAQQVKTSLDSLTAELDALVA